MIEILVATLILAGLSIVNYKLTDKMLKLGGEEKNPLVAKLLEKYGMKGLRNTNIVVVLLAGLAGLLKIVAPLAILIFLYLLSTAINFKEYKKLG